MKIAVCGDIHMCKKSSIISGNGAKYSVRLENCLKSINWFEKLAQERGCDAIVYLGDFFNTSDLDEQTITAVKDINWSPIKKYVLVGNHDSSEGDLKYSATNIVSQENIQVINTPTQLGNLMFLPYITEVERKPLNEYFTAAAKSVIFSHNDIKGIQLGPVESKTGFDKQDIEHSCGLFVNGHLHNGGKVGSNIINLGILTGQNFGEDAARYAHNIMILDSETLDYELVENPFAFNFYKLDVMTEQDLVVFDRLKAQAVLSIKCKDTLAEQLKAKLAEHRENIVAERIVIAKELAASDTPDADISELVMDHLEKLIQCCHEHLENTAILDFELAEICKN